MDEFKDPEKITEAMKSGLSRMYADNEFRDYLVHSMNVANHNVLVSLKADKPDAAKEFAIRHDTLKQLIEKGKAMYVQSEKLRSKSLEEQISQKYENETAR